MCAFPKDCEDGPGECYKDVNYCIYPPKKGAAPC